MDVHFLTPEQLRKRLSMLPFSLPLVLLSESGADRLGITSFLEEQQNKKKMLWYQYTVPNPTQDTLYQVFSWLHGRMIDGIIAIGGGSTIDLAKAVSAFHSMPETGSSELLLRAVVDKAFLSNGHHALPIIAVPTTAGTGSEVTQWATIWDAGGSAKYSIDALWLKPSQAWIVPQLCASLPPKLKLATGLDAVCHAVEAYWAKASNPLSKALSISALQIMINNLQPGLANPSDETINEKLCTGALLAGLAFSTTRTTACHSISYPLTYMFGMEHGFAVAVSLAKVAEVNQEVCDISEVLEVFSQYSGIQAWLDSTCEGIVQLRLRAFGINRQDIDKIAANSFSAGRMDNNPIDLSIETVKRILYSVY